MAHKLLSIIQELMDSMAVLQVNNERTYPDVFSIKNEELYFRDFNFDLKRKSVKVKVMLNYLDVIYNKDVIEGKLLAKRTCKNWNSRVNYKIKPKHTLRSEFQYLSVDKRRILQRSRRLGNGIARIYLFSIGFCFCRSI